MIGSAYPHLPRPSRLRAAVLSLTRPAAIDTDEVARVSRAFGLSVTNQTNVRHNRRSRNLILETDVGRVVMKRYRPGWLPQTVACVHSILRRLEQIEEPGPRLVPTVEGDDWLNMGDGVYAVFRFIEGASYASTFLLRKHRLEITSKAARSLARTHESLMDFVPEGDHHHGIDPDTGKPKRDLQWHVNMVRALKEKTGDIQASEDAKLAHSLHEESDGLLETLADLDSMIDAADLPVTVIHGDYGIHNLIFPADRSPVPIDFELSRLDWRINDLISAAGKHRYRGGDYDLESMKTFLRAYDDRFRLDDQERKLMAEAWSHYKLRAAVQYWNSYHQTQGPTRKLRSALDSIAQARQVMADPDPIRQLVER